MTPQRPHIHKINDTSFYFYKKGLTLFADDLFCLLSSIFVYCFFHSLFIFLFFLFFFTGVDFQVGNLVFCYSLACVIISSVSETLYWRMAYLHVKIQIRCVSGTFFFFFFILFPSLFFLWKIWFNCYWLFIVTLEY